jgi:hypothetical protein
MEVIIYKPHFTESYGKLTSSTVLEYVKQEYPVDEDITEQDIEIYDETLISIRWANPKVFHEG